MNVRLLPFLLMAALAACGIFGSDDDDCENFDEILGCLDDPGRDIIVTGINAGTQPVHLFIGSGESFPCCQVQPGSSRSATATGRVGGQVGISAGRNGNILQSSSCRVTQTEFDNRAKTITWNDPGFSC